MIVLLNTVKLKPLMETAIDRMGNEAGTQRPEGR